MKRGSILVWFVHRHSQHMRPGRTAFSRFWKPNRIAVSMPNSDPMYFHQEQFAIVEFLLRMRVQEWHQPRHELGDDLQVVVQLNADNPQGPTTVC